MMSSSQRFSTGVTGLDQVTNGGFLPGRAYLVRGGPGTGKTTLGLHFLTDGSEPDDSCLFVTLGESETQVRENGKALGLDLGGVSFLDLSPTSDFFAEGEGYDIFSPVEVEGKPTNERIREAVEEADPTRVFIDSMTQFRHLTADAYLFRKQVLSFLRFLVDREVTVVFSSESVEDAADEDLQFMADGVLSFSSHSDERVLEVTKLRGSGFRAGRHSVRLSDTGMKVFPRLVPKDFRRDVQPEPIPMGIPAMDELLGGGIERGTVTIVSGPSGVGKTSIAMQFAREAAGRGERTAIYLFEERMDILLSRCRSINIPIDVMAEDGRIHIDYIEPLRFTPDEFAAEVRHQVEVEDTRIVVLDSVLGYRLALSDSDPSLASNLHALCKYLTNMGVAVVVTNEVQQITGDFRATEVGVSFIADNIVYLRYYEANGGLQKAIGVLKKRLSSFENSLRSLEITPYGIKIGAPLDGMRGILSGSPKILDGAASDGRGGRGGQERGAAG